MSLLEFLKFKKKKFPSPKIEVDPKSRKKYPERIRVKKSPTGEFLKSSKDNGLTNIELNFLQNNIFRITGEYELSEAHKRKVAKWIKIFINQNRDGAAIWEIIDHVDTWRENLINAFAECATNGEDPKLNFLYGALYTLLDAHDNQKSSFLETYKSIKDILVEAKRINEENQRERKAKKYSEDIVKWVDDSGMQFTSPSRDFIKQEIEKIIFENNPKRWHEKIYKVLEVSLGENTLSKILNGKIFNENFLENINPEIPIQRISKEDFRDSSYVFYSTFELFTWAQLIEESNKLKHCVGDSDYYYNKIKNGDIRIFSIRTEDRSGDKYDPDYTIEYDVKTKKILQFRGLNDKLVDDEMLNLAIENLRDSGIEVKGLDLGEGVFVFNEGTEYALIEPSEKDDKDYLEQVCDLLDRGFTNSDTQPILFVPNDNLNLLSDLLEYVNVFIRFHWYLTDSSFPISKEFIFPKVISASLYLANQTTLYDSDGPYSRELLMTFPTVKKIVGKVYMDIKYNYERSKRDSKRRFPVLEEVEETIDIAFSNFYDKYYVKWFVEFNFPKLVKKYGGYEKLIESGKIRVGNLTELRY